jgi:broad specificity phosphatase PhoE
MDRVTRIWLIRHGEPVAEARGRCYGSMDFGLSDEGRAQAARAAEFLRGEEIAAVYASPLCRALDTARVLCELPVRVDSRLSELRFGDLEGLGYGEIAERYPEIYKAWMESPTTVQFPNGESFAEMRVRVLAAFDEICRANVGSSIAIVSHSGVNRILLAWALQMPDAALFRIAQKHAAINLIAIADGFPSVELLNA